MAGLSCRSAAQAVTFAIWRFDRAATEGGRGSNFTALKLARRATIRRYSLSPAGDRPAEGNDPVGR